VCVSERGVGLRVWWEWREGDGMHEEGLQSSQERMSCLIGRESGGKKGGAAQSGVDGQQNPALVLLLFSRPLLLHSLVLFIRVKFLIHCGSGHHGRHTWQPQLLPYCLSVDTLCHSLTHISTLYDNSQPRRGPPSTRPRRVRPPCGQPRPTLFQEQ